MKGRSTEEPQGGLPRNYLRASLLLLIAETPAHGYDLLEQIAQLGLRNVDPGGLYRALRVMEQDGLVASWWEHSTAGPARRSYRLTDEGVEWLTPGPAPVGAAASCRPTWPATTRSSRAPQ